MESKKSVQKNKKKAEIKKFYCKTCKMALKSKYFFDRHKATKHPKMHRKFICDYDGKDFDRKNYLRIHLERHRTDEIVTCSVCSKAYSSQRILKRHLLSHLDKYSCTECDASFSHKVLLNNHLSTHKEELLYKCKYCTRMFKNHSSRNNHHQTAHKNSKTELNFKCKECKIFFETKEDLRIHSFIHFDREIKSCHFCDQIFKTTKSLNIHLQKHSEQKKFQCETCRERFTFKTGLRKHIRLNRCKLINDEEMDMTEEEIAKVAKEQLYSLQHLKSKNQDLQELNTETFPDDIEIESDVVSIIGPADNEEQSPSMYICDKCGESLKCRKSLERHMKRSHLRKTYRCKNCTEIFKSKINFNSHLLDVHGEEPQEIDRFHICNVCKKTFKSLGNLKRHSLTHTKDRNFLCDACPKSFKSQISLKIHKDSVHASVKFYVSCPHCKSIIQEKNLKNHVFNQHTEEGQMKPFSCNVCDKKFKNDFLLKRHTELQHLGTNRGVNYECGECGQSFNRQRDLRNHSFEHFAGAVHTCSCGKKFKNKRLLLIHSAVHTTDILYACNKCESVFKTLGGRRKHLAKHHKIVKELEEEIVVEAL